MSLVTVHEVQPRMTVGAAAPLKSEPAMKKGHRLLENSSRRLLNGALPMAVRWKAQPGGRRGASASSPKCLAICSALRMATAPPSTSTRLVICPRLLLMFANKLWFCPSAAQNGASRPRARGRAGRTRIGADWGASSRTSSANRKFVRSVSFASPSCAPNPLAPRLVGIGGASARAKPRGDRI
eukprot:9493262-Pyramimonas_sp.AAC.2